ncbi:hypothetical protein GGX14DRAFT_394014 [Mycena pura]|uniref:Uncharacterized protein n=1 Tax=Mycena pura TaxID=153505 RepID=A0AAD6VN76_9AGAR|nr:hypothetical protein GGX14DRAFT_394014 [Mycena pura]
MYDLSEDIETTKVPQSLEKLSPITNISRIARASPGQSTLYTMGHWWGRRDPAVQDSTLSHARVDDVHLLFTYTTAVGFCLLYAATSAGESRHLAQGRYPTFEARGVLIPLMVRISVPLRLYNYLLGPVKRVTYYRESE